MVKLNARSALESGYVLGTHGARLDNPIRLWERRGLIMHNLAVWDTEAVNGLLQPQLGIRLPETGQSTVNSSACVLWTGPGRYLIAAGEPGTAEILSAVSDEHCALQDMSSARTVVRIQGDACRSMMAKGLTVNIAKQVFTTGQVILSSFDHHYPVIIHNVSSDIDTFDIYITRSFALSFWHWLCDSSLEFGYQVIDAETNG